MRIYVRLVLFSLFEIVIIHVTTVITRPLYYREIPWCLRNISTSGILKCSLSSVRSSGGLGVVLISPLTILTRRYLVISNPSNIEPAYSMKVGMVRNGQIHGFRYSRISIMNSFIISLLICRKSNMWTRNLMIFH